MKPAVFASPRRFVECSPGDVAIIKGKMSRDKVIAIEGLADEEVNLHFSPRGEAKCVRGPRSNTVFKVFHETRVTRHETRPFFACFGRRVVRNAG